ncbi:MAG: protein kinase [Chloroflexota bacterium]|nr:protein kinase [Chloroflexota bacterium]
MTESELKPTPLHSMLQTKLGSGSVGEVWRALAERGDVAIKFINQPDDPQQRKSLETEMNALRQLDHPAIPTLYDFDLDGERPYISMEYVAGEPFHHLIASGAIWQIGLERRLAILAQIADAAAHLHAHGLIHRDIKPANLIGTDAPHLIDYGIAADIGMPAAPAGTPFYMFPDDQPPDIVHDAFGFALTAYELLFGVHAIFTVQDGGRARADIQALAQQRLRDGAWRLPSRLPAHEVPYDLRGVDLARLDGVFASALDWRAAQPITPAALIADLQAVVLTPENQPFLDAMPAWIASLARESANEGASDGATVHPPEPARADLRFNRLLIAALIVNGVAIVIIVILQTVL